MPSTISNTLKNPCETKFMYLSDYKIFFRILIPLANFLHAEKVDQSEILLALYR